MTPRVYRFLTPRAALRRVLAPWLPVLLAGCGGVVSDTNPDADTCPARTWIPVAVANASLDDDGGWTVEPLTNPPICATDVFGIPPDSEPNAACFGVANSVSQTLTQPIALPAGTTQIRLRGVRCLVTTEPPDAPVKDAFVVEVTDAETLLPVASLVGWSNQDAEPFCAWEPFEVMAPVAGDTASPLLTLRGQHDDLEVTTFFLDTLALDAYGCP